jgi:hypothetical protein
VTGIIVVVVVVVIVVVACFQMGVRSRFISEELTINAIKELLFFSVMVLRREEVADWVALVAAAILRRAVSSPFSLVVVLREDAASFRQGFWHQQNLFPFPLRLVSHPAAFITSSSNDRISLGLKCRSYYHP